MDLGEFSLELQQLSYFLQISVVLVIFVHFFGIRSGGARGLPIKDPRDQRVAPQ